MRLAISFILSIIIAVGLVAFAFTLYQSSTEKTKLNGELEIRTRQVVDEIYHSDPWFFEKIDKRNIDHLADSINKHYNSLGFAIYYNYDSILSNYTAGSFLTYSKAYIYQSITADTSLGNFLNQTRKKLICM